MIKAVTVYDVVCDVKGCEETTRSDTRPTIRHAIGRKLVDLCPKHAEELYKGELKEKDIEIPKAKKKAKGS